MPIAFVHSLLACMSWISGGGKGERGQGRAEFEHFSARERGGTLIG